VKSNPVPFQGKTLGTPIAIKVSNEDQRPEAYSEMAKAYRPSHADYTYDAKYGIRNWQGGGRAFARETIGRVAVVAVRKEGSPLAGPQAGNRRLRQEHQGHRWADRSRYRAVQHRGIEHRALRRPNAVDAMIELIQRVRSEGNSVGGVVECVVRGVPQVGGNRFSNKLEADLAKAMMSLPATKGFEIGSGFSGTLMTGAEHNDEFYMEGDTVRTRTNRSGGIQWAFPMASPSSGSPSNQRPHWLRPQATVLGDRVETELSRAVVTIRASCCARSLWWKP